MPRSTDSVDAKLTPREAVLTRNAAELLGRDKIAHLNAMGNMMAQHGIDLPTLHAQYGNEDVNMNNPLYYQTGTDDVGFSGYQQQPMTWDSGIPGGGYGQQPMPWTPRGVIESNDPVQAFTGGPFAIPQQSHHQMMPHGRYAYRRDYSPGYTGEEGPGSFFVGAGGGGSRGRNLRMFQTGTSSVGADPVWNPITGQDDPRLQSMFPASPPVSPPASPPVNNPVTASKWTPEQQAIVDRINSGRVDKMFGPGVPKPSAEDLQTFVGGKHAPAAGYQQEGGVALAKKEYNLFTPEQRRELGIIDIGPERNAGLIERWYGTPAAWAGVSDAGAAQASASRYANPTQGSYARIQDGVYSLDPSGDYAKAVAGTSGPSEFGEGVGRFGSYVSKAGANLASVAAQQAQQGTSTGLSMIGGISGSPYERDALSAYYASLQNPTVFGRGG